MRVATSFVHQHVRAGTHAARLRKFVTAAVSEEPEHIHGPM